MTSSLPSTTVDRGVTSVIGQLLVLGLIVSLITITGAVVLTDVWADARSSSSPVIEVEIDVGSEVVVTHKGGERIPTDDLRIVVRAAGGSVWESVVSAGAADGTNDGTFEVGETYRFDNASIPSGDLRVLLVHVPTNALLSDETFSGVSLAASLADLTVEHAPLNESDVGTSLQVTAVFSEGMNVSVDPSVSISGLNRSYTVTGDWTASDNTTWEGTVTIEDDDEEATATVNISGAEDTAGNTVPADESNTFEVDTRTPTILEFSASNPSERDINVTFTADEQLATVSVDVSDADGTTETTLTATDFAETESGGNYTYTTTYTANKLESYTVTLQAAADDLDNDGSAGQTEAVDLAPFTADIAADCSGLTCTFNGSASGGTPGPIAIDFGSYTFESYGGSNQDQSGGVTLINDTTARFTNNTWKLIDYSYTITSDTILEFDFRSGVEGEIHGIGFDTDSSISANRVFQLYGTQNWGIADFHNYSTAAPEWKHYRIPIGEHYTGTFDHLVFTNDHDVGNPDAESVFKNVTVYEAGDDGYEYDWEFGDGGTATGRNVSHTYGSGGTYTVNLTVTDGEGETANASRSVTVAGNQPPTAAFTHSPDVPAPGESASFNASTATDSDGTIDTYEWDWDDDGTYETSSSSSTTNHTFNAQGEHNVTLRVTDDAGATDTVTEAVTVTETPVAASTVIDNEDWYDAAWLNRKPITIDPTAVTADLSNFPVLVKLSDADLAANAQPDGDDILFATADGTTKLDHEIETFNGSSGELVAWVEVPAVNGSAPGTVIYMYYNNSGAANQEDVAGTWTNGYRSVWHLSEAPDGAIDGVVTQAAMDGANGGWAVTYGASSIESSKLNLAIDEDQISDSERRHTEEQVGYWVFDTADTSSTTIHDANGTVIGEFGTVSDVGTSFTTVSLTETYSDPVLITSYNLPSSSDRPAVTRVRNVGGSSYEVKIQNPGGGNTPTAGDVFYLVVEAGSHTLPGSVPVEAGTVTPGGTNHQGDWSTDSMVSISPNNSYTDPVVLGQVMTHNDPAWSTFWTRAGSARQDPPTASSIYVGKHVAEDSDTTRSSEDVGYVIIEESTGTTNGIPWKAALGGESVRGVGDSLPYSYSLPYGSDTVVDSTGNDLSGTNVGAEEGVAGQIASGYSFDGSNDYVALSDHFDTAGTLSSFTVMAWVKVPADGGDWSILDFDRSEYFTAAVGVQSGSINGEGGAVFFGTADSTGSIHDQWSSNSTLNDGEWHLITWVFDASSTDDKRLYIDGALDSSADQHGTDDAVGTGTTRYGFIGDGSEAGSEDGGRNNLNYQGDVDDLRFSTTVRSADWIATFYENTGSPGAFVDVGEQETKGVVSFNASTSTDPDGSIATYEWDWDDDGTYEASTSSPTIDHTFDTSGTHTVTLRVTDDIGATNTTTVDVTAE